MSEAEETEEIVDSISVVDESDESVVEVASSLVVDTASEVVDSASAVVEAASAVVDVFSSVVVSLAESAVVCVAVSPLSVLLESLEDESLEESVDFAASLALESAAYATAPKRDTEAREVSRSSGRGRKCVGHMVNVEYGFRVGSNDGGELAFGETREESVSVST